MHGVVSIKGLDTLYSLIELPLPEDRQELDIVEEGATIIVPHNIAEWPIGTDRPPPPAPGRCKTDPEKYRLFRLASEVEPAGYEPTGLMYGGAYSPEQWRRLAEAIPAIRAFESIPADPPGVMSEARRHIREG